VSKIRTGFLCIYRYPLSCFYKNKAVVVALCGYRRGHGMEIIFVWRGGGGRPAKKSVYKNHCWTGYHGWFLRLSWWRIVFHSAHSLTCLYSFRYSPTVFIFSLNA
jgi:hypothetical protein